MTQRNIHLLLDQCLHLSRVEDWAELIDRLFPLVTGVVTRSARSCGIADLSVTDDLVQDTFLKLLRQERSSLARFRAAHDNELALYAFVKVIASHVVLDYRKRQSAGKRDRSTEVALEAPETSSIGHHFAPDLLSIDIDRTFREVPIEARDQTIFWLYFRQGYTAQEIACMPFGLSTKGVEACLFRLTRLLREQLRVPLLATLPRRDRTHLSSSRLAPTTYGTRPRASQTPSLREALG